ncbi:MAG: hypothetical protein M9894_08700 [Planctomycetes bacterium]|nr:hypothetical protein [Planctomycetota bacterium]
MDERRRDRERAAAQGDHAAAVEALRHQLRAGELPEERLELLAFLGDEVAAAALGRAVEPWPTDEQDRRARTRDLARWGIECLGRAGAALARAGLTLNGDERVRAAADAIDAWVSCPCDEHVKRAEDAGADGAERAADQATGDGPSWGASCVALVASGVSRQESIWTRVHGHSQRHRDAWTAVDLSRAMESLWHAGLEPVEVLLAELRPWVLGTGDPVRERVAGRSGWRNTHDRGGRGA